MSRSAPLSVVPGGPADAEQALPAGTEVIAEGVARNDGEAHRPPLVGTRPGHRHRHVGLRPIDAGVDLHRPLQFARPDAVLAVGRDRVERVGPFHGREILQRQGKQPEILRAGRPRGRARQIETMLGGADQRFAGGFFQRLHGRMPRRKRLPALGARGAQLCLGEDVSDRRIRAGDRQAHLGVDGKISVEGCAAARSVR